MKNKSRKFAFLSLFALVLGVAASSLVSNQNAVPTRAATESITFSLKTTGVSGSAYVTSSPAFTIDGFGFVANNFNPSTGQTRGNGTTTTNFLLYNTTALPGRLVSIEMTFTGNTKTTTASGRNSLTVGSSVITSGSAGIAPSSQLTTAYTWTVPDGTDGTFFNLYNFEGAGTVLNTGIVITYETGPVGPAPVTGVTIDGPATVAIGKTAQLTAVIAPTNATNKNVAWSAIGGVTVSTTGLVTGVSLGAATIMVETEDGGYTASHVMQVVDVPVVESVTLTWSNHNTPTATGYADRVWDNTDVFGGYEFAGTGLYRSGTEAKPEIQGNSNRYSKIYNTTPFYEITGISYHTATGTIAATSAKAEIRLGNSQNPTAKVIALGSGTSYTLSTKDVWVEFDSSLIGGTYEYFDIVWTSGAAYFVEFTIDFASEPISNEINYEMVGLIQDILDVLSDPLHTLQIADADNVAFISSEYARLNQASKDYLDEQNGTDVSAVISDLVAQMDQLRAATVSALISAIPAVSSLTVHDGGSISAARTAYDGLNGTQKALVGNYSVLQAAEARMVELIAIEDVIQMIIALPEAASVTTDNRTAIVSARTAYNALSTDNQALVTNIQKLLDVEEALRSLIGDTQTATITRVGTSAITTGVANGELINHPELAVENSGTSAISVMYNSNSGTSSIFNNAAKQLRLYANGTLTISVEAATITSITLIGVLDPVATAAVQINGASYTMGSTVEGTFEEVVIKTITGQTRMTGIEITYSESVTPDLSIVLDTTAISLPIGQSYIFIKTILNGEGTETVSWSTTDPLIVNVANGIVTAISSGVATIRVTIVGTEVYAECTVSVYAPVDWREVNDTTSRLRDGDQVIIANATGTAVAGALNTSKYLESVTTSNIAEVETTYAFKVVAVASGFELHTDAGKLGISATGNNNIVISDSPTYSVFSWYKAATGRLQFVGTNVSLQFNSSTPRFSNYSSNQAALTLYRMAGTDSLATLMAALRMDEFIGSNNRPNGSCLDGDLISARGIYNSLTAEQMEVFTSSELYADAYARYQAWSVNMPESLIAANSSVLNTGNTSLLIVITLAIVYVGLISIVIISRRKTRRAN